MEEASTTAHVEELEPEASADVTNDTSDSENENNSTEKSAETTEESASENAQSDTMNNAFAGVKKEARRKALEEGKKIGYAQGVEQAKYDLAYSQNPQMQQSVQHPVQDFPQSPMTNGYAVAPPPVVNAESIRLAKQELQTEKGVKLHEDGFSKYDDWNEAVGPIVQRALTRDPYFKEFLETAAKTGGHQLMYKLAKEPALRSEIFNAESSEWESLLRKSNHKSEKSITKVIKNAVKPVSTIKSTPHKGDTTSTWEEDCRNVKKLMR